MMKLPVEPLECGVPLLRFLWECVLITKGREGEGEQRAGGTKAERR